MSIVILGGNECMECRYKALCSQFDCRAKIITKTSGTLKNKIGDPELLILFTGTISHKMVRSALCETKGKDTVIERCHTSSISALRAILQQHSEKGGALCQMR